MANKGKINPPEIWVAQAIIKLIEEGNTPPWMKTWSVADKMFPRNIDRMETSYKGMNLMLLSMLSEMYESPLFVSPYVLNKMGGKKKEGEKTWPVFFYKPIKDKEDENKIKFWLCKGYKVYNVMQTQGIEDKIPEIPQPETFEHDPMDACESIVKSYENCPPIKEGGSKAYYAPVEDYIQMPKAERFKTRESYYATLFHEMAHSTGHSSRLDRDFSTNHINEHSYSQEELVAEFASAMLCAEGGIEKNIIDNSAAYIKHWSEKLKENPEALVYATRDARKAFAHILKRSEYQSNEEAA